MISPSVCWYHLAVTGQPKSIEVKLFRTRVRRHYLQRRSVKVRKSPLDSTSLTPGLSVSQSERSILLQTSNTSYKLLTLSSRGDTRPFTSRAARLPSRHVAALSARKIKTLCLSTSYTHPPTSLTNSLSQPTSSQTSSIFPPSSTHLFNTQYT
jgi:hypothetical protein